MARKETTISAVDTCSHIIDIYVGVCVHAIVCVCVCLDLSLFIGGSKVG